MVVYETQGNTVKAYSDLGLKIHGGFPEADYDVAYDPVSSGRTYVETDQPIDTQTQPSWRTFSILGIESELFKLNLLDKLDAFLDETMVANGLGGQVPLRRFYDRANDIRDDHPLFAQYFQDAKTVLGIDDQTAEAILNASETHE